MNATEDGLRTASELAEELGTTARALRFYELKGLIKPQRVGTRRVYGRRDRGRIQRILRGKRLGLSLAQIKGYLELYDADIVDHEEVHALAALVAERIADLERRRSALETTLSELCDLQHRVEQALARSATVDDRGRD